MGNKKKNIIEINGRRYDAHTGNALDHEHHGSSIVKPVTVRHETDEPAPKPNATSHPASRRSRQAARHASRHKPQRSATLMRRAVRKPQANLKRSLKVKAQSHTNTLTEQPLAEIYRPPSIGIPDDKRLKRATHVKKSSLIAHFNPNQPSYRTPAPVSRPSAKPTSATPDKTVPRAAAPDIDDIFERAIQNATSHLEPAPKRPRKRRLRLSRRHHAKV